MTTRVQLGILFALAAAVSGCHESSSPPTLSSKADRTIDLTGTDQPADLTTHEDAAKATVALVSIVTAAAQVVGELGRAAGDLFPDEDNPCPGGGSASSSVGGSFNNPRLRMTFSQCVRGDFTLDGRATITCDDLDDSGCPSGSLYVGDGETVLHFQRPEGVVLMVGNTVINTNQDAGQLHAVADLKGEIRSIDEVRGYSFLTQALDLDIRRAADDQVDVRITGVAATGGGADDVNCSAGRFDNETPTEPLRIDENVIRSGFLLLHSPPPRPGAQQAQSRFVDGGMEAQGANGETQFYAPADWVPFCSP